ncbi:MAG: TIGR03790 family protein [Chthoniobacterales bacterium]
MMVSGSKFRIFISIALLSATSAGTATPPNPSADARATIVIYNQNDPDSKSLANYYGEKRNIPADQVIGLNAPMTEEITRKQYVESIQNPLRKIFTDKGWWKVETLSSGTRSAKMSTIHFAALVRGMPLKIAPDTSVSGIDSKLPDVIRSRNEASVAAELTCLAMYDYLLNGGIPNPYYRRYTSIQDASLGVSLLLTSQLDGPTSADVRRMIDDSIETERKGLRGWAYVDARGITTGGYAEGDKWLTAAARQMQSTGIPVIYDNDPELFDADFPFQQVALYYGWYAGNLCGPFLKPDFHFQKGAVAVHIHSYSAYTLRSPTSNWSGPLISKGAAATLGNVYEPYLALTTELDVFQDRLQNGFTLAESAWMGTRALSWMNTVVGDPLYRPFKFLTDISLAPNPKNKVWRDCRKILIDAGGISVAAAPAFEAAAAKTGDAIYLEFLAAAYGVDGKTDLALATLIKAAQETKDQDQRFRLVLKRIFLLARNKQQGAASNLARDSQSLFSAPDKMKVLVRLAGELDPLMKVKVQPAK